MVFVFKTGCRDLKRVGLKGCVGTKSHICKYEQSGWAGSSGCSREYGYVHIDALCPAFGLAGNTHLCKSSAQHAGFISIDLFMLVFRSKKEFNCEWASLFKWLSRLRHLASFLVTGRAGSGSCLQPHSVCRLGYHSEFCIQNFQGCACWYLTSTALLQEVKGNLSVTFRQCCWVSAVCRECCLWSTDSRKALTLTLSWTLAFNAGLFLARGIGCSVSRSEPALTAPLCSAWSSAPQQAAVPTAAPRGLHWLPAAPCSQAENNAQLFVGMLLVFVLSQSLSCEKMIWTGFGGCEKGNWSASQGHVTAEKALQHLFLCHCQRQRLVLLSAKL